jgi:asparagine synthase (glutamine-hydrolysing)
LQSYNFLNHIAADEMFNTDYLSGVDTGAPLRLLQDVYGTPSKATALNRMLYLDWHFTLADNDLRKVSNMCALAGVEVAYPLLTDELIDFSLKVPSKLKIKGSKLRYFFKESLRGFLPPQTLSKSKHGFGLPFGVWLREYEPLREMARDSLQKLKTRGYFKPSFIDNAINMHEQGHASYHGELVWLLMMLELWLQAHQDAAA